MCVYIHTYTHATEGPLIENTRKSLYYSIFFEVQSR